MAVVALTLLAAFAMQSSVLTGHDVQGRDLLPQPISWIRQVLALESWPTYDTYEIRWPAWTVGTLVLTILMAASARRLAVPRESTVLLAGLAGYSTILLALVAILAMTSPIPLVGLSWTWQLAAALTWMLVLYWWAVRVPIDASARALALSVAALAAISLLCLLQIHERYPNWPVGNVLPLTTACLAGVFLTGTWACELFLAVRRTHRTGVWIGALVVTALLLVLLVTAALAGRRAALLGLLAGAAFIVVLTLARGRRSRIGLLAIALLAMALAAVLVPRLFKSGRWETVVFRAALYKNTIALIGQHPLTGVGPGHLGAHLTTTMRPLNAESPRLFHGELSTQGHSEPLHALAELGVPVALLYLILPLGGLACYAAAYRREPRDRQRLALLGLGAALAAALAAEATSVGMRKPGVAALVWALVGIGYACGVRSGALDAIVGRLQRVPVGSAWPRLVLLAVPVAVAAGLCALAGMSVKSSYHLGNGRTTWKGHNLALADAELDRAVLPIDVDQWMMCQYLRGRVNMAIAQGATLPRDRAARRQKALAALAPLVDACPGFLDSQVWLGRATDDPNQLLLRCRALCKLDPYEPEALLVLMDESDSSVDRLRYLRAALRRQGVYTSLAWIIGQEAQDSAAQAVLRQWLAEAGDTLSHAGGGSSPDPMALETFRLAVVVYGERGEIRQADRFARDAASLCDLLRQDVRQRRIEDVELETSLHEAWFGWLSRSQDTRRLRANLDKACHESIDGVASSFTARMALQFLATLEVIDNNGVDAVNHLLKSEGVDAPLDYVRQLYGMAYARLAATLAPPPASGPATTQHASDPAGPAPSVGPAPQQVAEWTRRGEHLLGPKKWGQALEWSAARRTAPWWHGVLTKN
jgi:hypothetical protein